MKFPTIKFPTIKFHPAKIDSMASEARFYRKKNKFIFWNEAESDYTTFKNYSDIKTKLSLYWQKELLKFDEHKFAPWVDEKLMMAFL